MTTDLRGTYVPSGQPAKTPDVVSSPLHYTSSPAKCSCGRTIECIDVVQWLPFNVGNVIKYCWRLGLKGDPIEDLRKAAQYIEFEIKRLEGEQLRTPDPARRLTLDESQALIKERHSGDIEELGRT